MASLVSVIPQVDEYLFPYLPQCPDAIRFQQIYRAAKHFCERTQLWTEILSLNLVADQQQYEFLSQLNDDAEWDQIECVFRTNEIDDLDTVSLAKANKTLLHPGNDYVMVRDEEEVWYLFLKTGNVTVTRLNSLHISSVMKIDREQMLMPEWILKDWQEAIAYGAQAYLKSQANVGWTDPYGAAEANKLFISGINEARIRKNKNYTNRKLQMGIPIAAKYDRMGLFGLNSGGERTAIRG